MKKIFLFILSLLIIVTIIPIVSSVMAKEDTTVGTSLIESFKKKNEDYREGEAIVLLESKTGASNKSDLKSFNVSDIDIIETIEFKDTGGVSLKSNENSFETTIMSVKSDKYSTKELIKKLKEMPNVKYAEPNYICKASALTMDTYSEYQWGLKNEGQNGGIDGVDIDVDAVWQTGKTGTDKVVAVVDTGIDYTHEDLKGCMWVNANQRTLLGKYGYDFANGDDNPIDDNGHGSHCAGIIAGQADNNKGISGVNKKAKLMALKWLDEEGYRRDV